MVAAGAHVRRSPWVVRGGSSHVGGYKERPLEPREFVARRRESEEEEEEEVVELLDDEEDDESGMPGDEDEPQVGRLADSLTVVAAEEESDEDECALGLAEAKMEELELFEGDIVRVRSGRGRATYCVAAARDEEDVWMASMSRVSRGNCRCKVGDRVRVEAASPKYARRVSLAPFDDTLEAVGFPKNVHPDVLLERCVVPHFAKAAKPLVAGDRVECRVVAPEEEGEEEGEDEGVVVGGVVEFKILEVESVDEDDEGTEVVVVPSGDPEAVEFSIEAEDGRYLSRGRDDERLDEISYDDLGGVSKALATIRELIEAPLKRPEIFRAVGVAPPRGVLLYGAPGCGKTSIARAVAEETGAYFFLINGAEILSKTTGEAEANLRKAFEQARKHEPAIVFIDELDAVAPRRDKAQGAGDAEKRAVQTLCELLDELNLEHGNAAVVVLAATNRPNSIDSALRRFGRLDREVDVGVPDADGRLDILRVRTRNMRLGDDVRLEDVARDTHGFVGADIAQLCLEAALECVREAYGPGTEDRRKLLAGYAAPGPVLVRDRHFSRALDRVNPSALRETAASLPKASWADVGGLDDVKRELYETVQFPVEHGAKFKKFGLPPSRGVLFYGPPGCGKTLLAQAVARECGANFVSIKGPELLTMWFGESEANVRDLFDKARQSAPCILFFDEIDAIAMQRGSGKGGASEAGDRVINQILTEIDGVGARKDVFVVGATNRPEVLDAAITRPGRLDTLVYIPLPDEQSRRSIFKATLRRSPIAPDVDLAVLAKFTPGFSGADVAEVCKRAARFAIKDAVDATTAGDEDVPKLITRDHFEMAMATARRSVTDADLAKYDAYAAKAKGAPNAKDGGGLDKPFRFDD
ncbi:hypothetical protein CTAYLR_002941 [Chrysophaeum taylorii]|uniref:Uncharacterized protein n=1 Tax=Chrysophaeum taylorii TaxID=2483200 RepID=A0AAD7XR32_9STRA|nr:hypothetical protein CTAYLR_002941 [Chrysophaeum taylorii]